MVETRSSSGACVVALLILLWIVATVGDPDTAQNAALNQKHSKLNKAASNHTTSPAELPLDSFKTNYNEPARIPRDPARSRHSHKGHKVSKLIHKPRQPHHKKHKTHNSYKPARPHKPHRPRPHYKQANNNSALNQSSIKGHLGFGFHGHTYYKGKFVACKPKQTLMCMDNECKVGTCTDVLRGINYSKCLVGLKSVKCNTPLVCGCDDSIGFVQASATDQTCMKMGECFTSKAYVKHEVRCSYIGCNDNATCDNAFNTSTDSKLLPACNSMHKLENCTTPTPHCPLMHYWNTENYCQHKDHCFSCSTPHSAAVCSSATCNITRDCNNTWDKPTCTRSETYPNCTTHPICRCDSENGYVNSGDTTKLTCIDKLECVTCKVNEYYACPDGECSERTFIDIEEGNENTPCEAVVDHSSKCNTKPVCHCQFPRIRDANGTCVLPAKIFTECNGKNDTSIAMCRTDKCDMRSCKNMTPKLCCGDSVCLYYCTKSKIFCQCIKGASIYNSDDASNSPLCVAKSYCDTMSAESDLYEDEGYEDAIEF